MEERYFKSLKSAFSHTESQLAKNFQFSIDEKLKARVAKSALVSGGILYTSSVFFTYPNQTFGMVALPLALLATRLPNNSQTRSLVSLSAFFFACQYALDFNNSLAGVVMSSVAFLRGYTLSNLNKVNNGKRKNISLAFAIAGISG